jgi:O-antigen biosynthesis protein WbqP
MSPKRVFDVVAALIGMVLLSLPAFLIAIAIRLTSKGPVLYWSDRVGRNNRLFSMPKFRTMRVDTPAVATHLLPEPSRYITPVGAFLRKMSLDEVPQLWSILVGDMSVVGPRPALFNQDDLIKLRTAAGIHALVPGLTGWAQVRGRDELPIPVKVEFDQYYLQHCSLAFDLKVIGLTLIQVIKGDGVQH